MLKKAIERIASLCCTYSGLNLLILTYNKLFYKIPVLSYHGVENTKENATPSCLTLKGMTVGTHNFRQHLEHLSKKHSVITLSDLVDFCSGKSKIPRNSVVLTFDDCYSDTFKTAVPLLDEYGFKATFFVIGKSLSESIPLWPHNLYQVLDSLNDRQVSLSMDGICRYSCSRLNASAKLQAINIIRKYADPLSEEAKHKLIHQLCIQNDLDFDTVFSNRYYMSRLELQYLQKSGHEIGAHSISHRMLSELDIESQIEEILGSKALISSEFSLEKMPFAFPFGQANSYRTETINKIKEGNYSCAVTTIEDLNCRTSDLFQLGRIRIGDCNIMEFKTNLTGLLGFIRQMGKPSRLI